MANWYIFHRFGILYQEKSGNPAQFFVIRPRFKESFFPLQEFSLTKSFSLIIIGK
jgi:hypothetical protein